MKTRMFISILILVLAVLIIAGSCATRKIAISDEELSNAYVGAWINPDATYYQKFEFLSDRKWQEYYRLVSDSVSEYGEHTIIDQWKDKDGNIFFESKFKTVRSGVSGFFLVKTNNSENTLEMLIEYGEYRIETWDPDSVFAYRIYYRQE